MVTRWLPRTSCERRHQPLARDAELLEDLAGGAGVVGHGEQQMLDRDVLVLELLGFVLGFGEQAVEAAGDVDLIGRAGRGRDLRQAVEFLLDAAVNLSGLHAGFQ